jgi:6-pyruvoyltetrahydropterin/6-carboxytetrahydropterin synthase
MYRLKAISEFSAAHFLRGYDGDCKNLHGHNWKVETTVKTKDTNSIGVAFDFKDIKKITDYVIKDLDHTNLNDLSAFKKENPTAENIARYIYKEIKKRLKVENVTLQSITIWESDKYSTTYYE